MDWQYKVSFIQKYKYLAKLWTDSIKLVSFKNKISGQVMDWQYKVSFIQKYKYLAKLWTDSIKLVSFKNINIWPSYGLIV